MSALDEITDIVLENVKLPSENSDRIIPFLQQIQKAYGDPIALVHDMGSGILNSVKEVFPNSPDYICHFHFLRDIGTDLFGIENTMLRKSIKEHKIKARLRKDARELEKHITETPELTNCLNTYLKSEKLEKPEINLRPIVTAYLLIKWILESDCELDGFGFPFDRAHLVFYQRLQQAHPSIMNLKNRLRHNDILSRSANALSKIVNDQTLQKTVVKMQKKVRVFDQLREAMRVALPESKKGLNDDGEKDIDMQTIEKRVAQLRESDELNQLASTDISYKKMLKQLDKYREKLFADPIQVNTPAGIISIQPQRTNNILERFFRDFKRGYRRRSGNHSLSKAIKAMIADTPLVKNLENPDYMKIILNGKNTLE
ncbi:MAG: transposase, partial [Gammaproteobacteria bacterium]|nr:transposase [Gammaproteobacteria bacterium]